MKINESLRIFFDEEKEKILIFDNKRKTKSTVDGNYSDNIDESCRKHKNSLPHGRELKRPANQLTSA